MISRHSHRKNEHVSLAEKFFTDSANADFDRVRLIHHSLPEINSHQVDPKTTLFNGQIKMKWPFYIEAMTGGSDETGKLNQQLAQIAALTDLTMASGSASVALKDPKTHESFQTIRKNLPNGNVFANIGAGHSLADAQKVITLLDADALEVHINVAQEMIMPEGDRDFHWMNELKNIVMNAPKPVIVKEVGFGMDQQTISTLINIVGASAINISGRGGTNFATIENFRRKHKEFSYLTNWGQTTVESLLEAQAFRGQVDIIASGGVRNPLDIAKAIGLGANAVGIAGAILDQLIQNGFAATVEMIKEWQNGLITIMTMLGCQNVSQLQSQHLLLDNELVNYVHQRQIKY
ncbi:type 2 isopentenyl-diphosphate Delta-isomerase [Nicoliella spurrieriana]|uniref:Isopentenyl-diphosphate delta-isomerase n=1 Tax=Nicoliella spurrieriana TaxID=2925830 RepID=A0A976RRQ8_9LACO|nr:type 2 isopentenyl-diphosphate Delta-isomerase [Nicoliella spurrieriana]UQS86617.1 type 2 isopentenyl-diphosphate Delta-isomerase [Nicoliella spurrieriana]